MVDETRSRRLDNWIVAAVLVLAIASPLIFIAYGAGLIGTVSITCESVDKDRCDFVSCLP